MSVAGHRASWGSSAFILLLALSSLSLVALQGVPTISASANAGVSVVSTTSSATCYDAETDYSFRCPVAVNEGNTIVVLVGCLSGPSPACGSPGAVIAVADSQGNVYAQAGASVSRCYAAVCEEAAFWARASATGNDTIAIASQILTYVAADIYIVSGANTTGIMSSTGNGIAGSTPTVVPYTPNPNGLVIAGVIANDGGIITAGAGYTLISGQPCFICGGKGGGWQGGEYALWGPSG